MHVAATTAQTIKCMKLQLSCPKHMTFNDFVEEEMNCVSDEDLKGFVDSKQGLLAYLKLIQKRNRKRFNAENRDAQGEALSASAQEVQKMRRFELLTALLRLTKSSA